LNKLMIYLGFLAFESGLDLNIEAMTYGLSYLYAKDHHEPGQACLFSADGFSAAEHVSSLRGSLSGQSQGQGFFLHGSILDDGLCPVDLSGVAARYRTEPARAGQAAVSHGPALQDRLAQHLGQRQR